MTNKGKTAWRRWNAGDEPIETSLSWAFDMATLGLNVVWVELDDAQCEQTCFDLSRAMAINEKMPRARSVTDHPVPCTRLELCFDGPEGHFVIAATVPNNDWPHIVATAPFRLKSQSRGMGDGKMALSLT